MKINLNLNHFIKNLQNPETVSGQNRVEPDNANSTKSNSQNLNPQNNVTLSNNIQLGALNRAEQAILIRDLLNLPKEFNQFLSLLIYKEVSPESLLKLMQEQNKGIQLQDIQNLLENNSKESIGKLLKLFQGAGSLQNPEQLNKIVNIISQAIPNQNASAQEVLTKSILLYLPWLPLVQQQNITLTFEEGKGAEDEQENVAIIMYISTVNLGRFKVIIILNNDKSLNIDIESEEKEGNKANLEEIEKNVNMAMSSNHIACQTTIFIQKTRNDTESQEKEISILPVGDISPRIMIAAYSIARIIFELDEKISLDHNRRMMLQ